MLAATGQYGCSYSSKIWKHFQLIKFTCFTQCQLIRAQISQGRDLSHSLAARLKNHLKNHHQAVVFKRGKEGIAGVPKWLSPVSPEVNCLVNCPVINYSADPECFALGKGYQASLTEMLGNVGTKVPGYTPSAHIMLMLPSLYKAPRDHGKAKFPQTFKITVHFTTKIGTLAQTHNTAWWQSNGIVRRGRETISIRQSEDHQTVNYQAQLHAELLNRYT